MCASFLAGCQRGRKIACEYKIADGPHTLLWLANMPEGGDSDPKSGVFCMLPAHRLRDAGITSLVPKGSLFYQLSAKLKLESPRSRGTCQNACGVNPWCISFSLHFGPFFHHTRLSIAPKYMIFGVLESLCKRKPITKKMERKYSIAGVGWRY